MAEIKILLIFEGSMDVTRTANLLKLFLENKLTSEKFSKIQIIEDKDRGTYLKANLPEKASVIIYLKNSINSNVKNLVDRLNDNGSIERMYNFPSRYFTYVYLFYDLDLGSTSLDNLENYLKLKELGENIYPILSYPGYEGDFYNYNYKAVIKNWEKVKDIFIEIKSKKFSKEYIKYKFEDNIFKNEEKLYFRKENYKITTIIKKFNEKIVEENLIKKSKNIQEIEENYKLILSKYFNREIDDFYYIDYQKEIFNEETKKDTLKIITFFLPVFYEILLQIKDE